MRLQGTMRPDQIISLLELGGPTVAMGDHDDHIHVGLPAALRHNKKLGQQALAVLKPGQWSDLIEQLRKIDNPVVPTKPSKYALPAPSARSDAHAANSAAAPFRFVQLEFGFLLGPADGRYLVRPPAPTSWRRVLALRTLGAPERRLLRGRRGNERGPGRGRAGADVTRHGHPARTVR